MWSISCYYWRIWCSRQCEDELFENFGFWQIESSNRKHELFWSDASCGLANFKTRLWKSWFGCECATEKDSCLPNHQTARFDGDREVFPSVVWMLKCAHSIWIQNEHWFRIRVEQCSQKVAQWAQKQVVDVLIKTWRQLQGHESLQCMVQEHCTSKGEHALPVQIVQIFAFRR